VIPRAVAGVLLALPAAPALATCPGWQACRDTWLWDGLLPGLIMAGLAIWVGGPLAFGAARWLTQGRHRGGTGDAGGDSAS
jgi:hypothetical protein